MEMVAGLGERIQAAREDRGLSVAQLARLMQCDHYTITLIEQGKTPDPRVSKIRAACQILHIDANYLLGLNV